MKKKIKRNLLKEIKNQYPELRFQERIALLELLRNVEKGELFCLPETAETGERLARRMGIYDVDARPCGCSDPQCMINVPVGDLIALYNKVVQKGI